MAWIQTQEEVEKAAVMVNSKEVNSKAATAVEIKEVASFKEAWLMAEQILQKVALVSFPSGAFLKEVISVTSSLVVQLP